MTEILVPIALFASIVFIVWLVSYFNNKKRIVAHDTLRHAIDQGQQVSPELIEKMSLLTDPVRSDLRRGVLFLAVGVAFLIFGGMVGAEEPESFRAIVGIAAFPILIGLAYVGLFFFARPKED